MVLGDDENGAEGRGCVLGWGGLGWVGWCVFRQSRIELFVGFLHGSNDIDSGDWFRLILI